MCFTQRCVCKQRNEAFFSFLCPGRTSCGHCILFYFLSRCSSMHIQRKFSYNFNEDFQYNFESCSQIKFNTFHAATVQSIGRKRDRSERQRKTDIERDQHILKHCSVLSTQTLVSKSIVIVAHKHIDSELSITFITAAAAFIVTASTVVAAAAAACYNYYSVLSIKRTSRICRVCRISHSKNRIRFVDYFFILFVHSFVISLLPIRLSLFFPSPWPIR